MTELCEGIGNLQAQKDTTMAQLASVGQLVHGLQESNRRLASEQKQCRQDSSRTLTEKQAAMLTCESKLIRADRDARNCKRALDDSTAVKNELWERNDQCVVLVRDSNAAMVELIKEKEKLLQDNMELVEKCRRMGPLRLLRRLFVGGQRQEKTKQQ
ncbi:expressed unknown protein [Seminavis robusta]|uniref:Uncharacterized protein n=1 Tax=Seminavis robusta TaxID=568900 RepID=A0A9N8EZN4_9STRA|nr:expressed unknown protein [Seminavis robusta]|eukprot:Sro3197_g345000.1 n/a (157) ;mRNA; f:1599-2069